MAEVVEVGARWSRVAGEAAPVGGGTRSPPDYAPNSPTDAEGTEASGTARRSDSSEAGQAAACPTFARCQRFVDSLGLLPRTLDPEHNICYCHAARQSPLPSSDSSQISSTCSSLPLVFGCSDVAC